MGQGESMAARILGRRGGLTRAMRMTRDERTQASRQAAEARWAQTRQPDAPPPPPRIRRKFHVPDPGWGEGLRGPARCGRWARYATGDHALLERLAVATVRATHPEAEAERDAWCRDCLRRVRAAHGLEAP